MGKVLHLVPELPARHDLVARRVDDGDVGRARVLGEDEKLEVDGGARGIGVHVLSVVGEGHALAEIPGRRWRSGEGGGERNEMRRLA